MSHADIVPRWGNSRSQRRAILVGAGFMSVPGTRCAAKAPTWTCSSCGNVGGVGVQRCHDGDWPRRQHVYFEAGSGGHHARASESGSRRGRGTSARSKDCCACSRQGAHSGGRRAWWIMALTQVVVGDVSSCGRRARAGRRHRARGTSPIDESMFTGESLRSPRRRARRCTPARSTGKAARVRDDGVGAQRARRIIRLVEEAQAEGADPATRRPRLGDIRAGRARDRAVTFGVAWLVAGDATNGAGATRSRCS